MEKDINVLVTLDLSEETQALIREVSDRIKLTVIPAHSPREISENRWAKTEVLYTHAVLPDLGLAPNLQWVQFNRAGIDPFITHPITRDEHIVATTMSGVITSQIAEYVLMAILAFGQKLPKLFRHQQKKTWPDHEGKWKGFLPVELRDSTVGILGYGSIGRQVARLLQPFGATVLAVKKDVLHPEDTGYFREGMGDPHGDFFDRLYPIEALHSFLEVSDFVVLTLPLTDSTRHILDTKAFEAMRTSAFLINVGRGELIDQPALLHALNTKQIAGAALDVFEKEPLAADSPMWEMENVIITPHISGLSRHNEEDTVSLFIENLNRFLADLPLYNRIDPARGY